MSRAERRAGPVLIDMPFTAEPPRLANPDLGLTRVVALAGRDDSYAADVTLLDVADHRLIRSGVELAHRVIDGRGEWYLRAPNWNSLPPRERIEPFAHGDLPEDLADLVMPFRRRATLGPVAAIAYERSAFELRGPGDQQADHLGRLLDERVTIRRGGVTTVRYREIRLVPGPVPLSDEQSSWLIATLESAGGTVVEEFPTLATRLGTPATGLTDYPEPRPVGPDSIFENFVESIFAGRLRGMIAADMAARTGEVAATARLIESANVLRDTLHALAPTLDPDWLADLEEELDWLQSALTDAGDDLDRVRATLRRERYLRLLDLLVTGVRGPRVDEDQADRPVAEILGRLLDDAVDRLLRHVEELGPDAADQEWAAAAAVAEEVGRIDRLSRGVLPKRARRAARRLRPAITQLIMVSDAGAAAAEAARRAGSANASEAFELGREHERNRHRRAIAQAEFADLRPKLIKKLGR